MHGHDANVAARPVPSYSVLESCPKTPVQDQLQDMPPLVHISMLNPLLLGNVTVVHEALSLLAEALQLHKAPV